MAITVLELFKVLPRTNCGECGVSTCLAFATQVIKEGEDLAKCPYLSGEALRLAEQVKGQQEQGVGRRRESLAIALEALQEKVAPLDFAALAPGLGALAGESGGRPFLEIPYFGHRLTVFKDQVRYPPEAAADPWDAILLYNYIASQGAGEPGGTWIAYKTLPNSVSKAKTMARLEGKLADHFAGRAEELRQRSLALGGGPAQVGEGAQVQMVFQPLPKLPVLLLFWEAEPEEGFQAQAHLLLDNRVLDFLDLESILFLVERLLGHLMEENEERPENG
ncbi:MAG: DUF3786 domain-containing protein [Deltaproteobacteria bacterium]|nr:DUF3786 domain-containing protein [Deltaproteobacteria bacterium]